MSVLPVSDAVHCNRPRSALQPLPQCTATAPAVHCIRPCSALPLFTANVCILSRKRLQPPSQTFATAIVNVCGEKMVKRRLLWNPFLHVFIVSRVFPLSSIACLWVRWRLLHYRHSKRIPDETGIHDTKRGKTIRKPLRPRIGYIHCGMMSDEGVNSPGLSQFG